METEARLTGLAKCAGCGAKVGAGTLASLLGDFKTHTDDRLLVGFDKSDDASVYRINDETALVQTIDFFPPVVDDPYRYGQIAAANAISDVYAMGASPHLALNVMCLPEQMEEETVREILRGGYDKAYEAGVIIAGGHTIHAPEPVYGLAVSGFAHPDAIWKNCGAREGDVLILTKPLGAGIITTAAKGDFVSPDALDRVILQMMTLNRTAAESIRPFSVHACTDVTGFGLMGHALEMAQGSGVSIRIDTKRVPYHAEAFACAESGFVPAGAYRNRDYVGKGAKKTADIALALEDILYDPQTSGGLLFAIPEAEENACMRTLTAAGIQASVIGHTAAYEDAYLYLE